MARMSFVFILLVAVFFDFTYHRVVFDELVGMLKGSKVPDGCFPG